MKRILIALIVAAVPAALFAAPFGPWNQPAGPAFLHPTEAGPYLRAEILQIESEMGSQKIGEVDMSGLVALRERLSIAAQKDDYVRKMSAHSYFLPGLGQFETGNTGSGFLFLGLDVATLAGTFLGAYYLLPEDLRLNKLDYLGNSFTTISNAWNGHTLPDYLPSMGVLLVGMIVDQTIRHFAASGAGRDAAAAIDRGSVNFTPRIGLGFMGFDVAY